MGVGKGKILGKERAPLGFEQLVMATQEGVLQMMELWKATCVVGRNKREENCWMY